MEKKNQGDAIDLSPEELLDLKLKQSTQSSNESPKEDKKKEDTTSIQNNEEGKKDLSSSENILSPVSKEVPPAPIEPFVEKKIDIEPSIKPETVSGSQESLEKNKKLDDIIENKTEENIISPEPEMELKKVEEPFTKEPTKLADEHSLIIIPSWGNVVGYPDMGYYVTKNQKVRNIISDPVIFFARKSARVHTKSGYIYFIFGLGEIYLKFEMQNGKYITDKRELNCIMLQDFAYDFASSGKNIALEDDKDIIFNETIIKIPFDMSFKSPSQKTFISGVIMRNAFIPYKDILVEMMDAVRNQSNSNFVFDNMDYLMLSATQDHFNELLISEKALSRKEYSTITALIGKIIPISDKVIDETFNDVEVSIISNGIIENYMRLRLVQYDPANFMTIIENLAKRYDLHAIPNDLIGAINPISKLTKKLVLESSKDKLNSFVSWPETIKRNNGWAVSKEDQDERQKQVFNKDIMVEKAYLPPSNQTAVDFDLSSYQPTTPEEAAKFELRSSQNPMVKPKILPRIPEVTEKDKKPEKIIELLQFIKDIAGQDYEMCEFGRACEMIRDQLKRIILQADYIWELSKFANQFVKQPPNLGLSIKDKKKVIERMDYWIGQINEEIKERERKAKEEQERLERERLEKERKERERLEQERKEKERIEAERKEQERIEKERLERERIEKERIERQKEEEYQRKLRELREQEIREKLEAENKRLYEEEQLKIKKQQEEMERLKKEQAEMKQRIKEEKKKKKEEEKRQKQLEKEKKKLEKLEKQKKKLENS